MTFPAFVVDTFTAVRFRGNPTGVVLLDDPADTAWMQAVAAEFNCPATAFIGSAKAEAGPRALRWFSPVAELALCGSGTLASAHVLGGEQSFQAGDRLLSCTKGSDALGSTSSRPSRPQRGAGNCGSAVTATMSS